MATMIDNAQVSLLSDAEVRVTRDFRTPRTLVSQAHTEPSLVKRWMLGPPGWSMPVCEMDVRPGRKYRWRWRSEENGEEFGSYGDFREVEAPGKMTHAEYHDCGDIGGAMPTTTSAIICTPFIEKNGLTTIVILMDFSSKDARDAAASTGMVDGREMNYERLDQIFAEQQGG
jgi:uncharacterized protein YndB with AHSA1/START domain